VVDALSVADPCAIARTVSNTLSDSANGWLFLEGIRPGHPSDIKSVRITAIAIEADKPTAKPIARVATQFQPKDRKAIGEQTK